MDPSAVGLKMTFQAQIHFSEVELNHARFIHCIISDFIRNIFRQWPALLEASPALALEGGGNKAPALRITGGQERRGGGEEVMTGSRMEMNQVPPIRYIVEQKEEIGVKVLEEILGGKK